MAAERSAACTDAERAIWERYAVRARESHLPILLRHFTALCAAVHERGLDWRATAVGDTIGFKAPGERTFKVCLHATAQTSRTRGGTVPPSLIVHPRDSLLKLGVADPYPERTSFDNEFGGHGWHLPPFGSLDVGRAIDIAVAHGCR